MALTQAEEGYTTRLEYQAQDAKVTKGGGEENCLNGNVALILPAEYRGQHQRHDVLVETAPSMPRL